MIGVHDGHWDADYPENDKGRQKCFKEGLEIAESGTEIHSIDIPESVALYALAAAAMGGSVSMARAVERAHNKSISPIAPVCDKYNKDMFDCSWGFCPLRLAIQNDKVDVVNYLLTLPYSALEAEGTQMQLEYYPERHVLERGFLAHAAKLGHKKIVEVLIDWELEINGQSSDEKMTPLHYAENKSSFHG